MHCKERENCGHGLLCNVVHQTTFTAFNRQLCKHDQLPVGPVAPSETLPLREILTDVEVGEAPLMTGDASDETSGCLLALPGYRQSNLINPPSHDESGEAFD